MTPARRRRLTGMTKTYTGASMSLDGYIAGPEESGFDLLFQWYGNGDVVVETARPDLTMHMTEMGARHFRGLIEMTGALVVGRRLYDLTNGWGGRHPMDVPVVVLTHDPPAPDDESFVFVTEGIEAAVAKAREIAGERVVGLNGGEIARQALEARLVDEIWIDLVPVLLGGGTPFFDHVKTAPVVLEGPLSIGDDKDVTHLRYRVRYE
jgi:dihydrofolate reductase